MARKPRWNVTALESGFEVVNLSSWKYFASFIQEKLKFSNYIWRGQTYANWLLEPSLDRIIKKNNITNGAKARTAHIEGFKFATRGRRGENACLYESEDDWWALGQHHGLATPLLDWTISPYVALFFAFIEESDADDPRAVWSLSQTSVKKANEKIKDKDIISLIKPFSNENSRLVNQGGLFTKAPPGVDVETWIKKHYKDEKRFVRLRKILMPNKDRDKVLVALNRMNINHLTLFPDLSGACQFTNINLVLEDY